MQNKSQWDKKFTENYNIGSIEIEHRLVHILFVDHPWTQQGICHEFSICHCHTFSLDVEVGIVGFKVKLLSNTKKMTSGTSRGAEAHVYFFFFTNSCHTLLHKGCFSSGFGFGLHSDFLLYCAMYNFSQV